MASSANRRFAKRRTSASSKRWLAPSRAVDINAQLFAMFVCMYRGAFLARILSLLLGHPYPTYITNISTFIF